MRIKKTHVVNILAIMLLSLFVIRCTKSKNDINGDLASSRFEIGADTLNPMQLGLLKGVWWLSPDDIHALFYIIGDSLYYTEEQQSPYFIELKKNTLIMSRDSSNFEFEIVKITNDSLILYDKSMNEYTKLSKSTVKN